jgi:hypothetical protein
LMMEHGIERDQLNPTERAKLKYSEWFDMDHKWQLYCASAAGELYAVQVLIRKGGSQDRFHFVGRTDNVDAAQDTCAFILLQVEALYRSHLPKGLSQRERAAYRKDFKYACACRVLRRCQDIAKGVGASTNALVVHRATLQKEISDFVGPTKTARSRAVTVKSSRALLDGTVAGDKVDVNRKVASTTRNGAPSQSLLLS